MLGLEPHTTHVPILPQRTHPYYPYKIAIVSTYSIDVSTYTGTDQERCEPITPTKLPASPQPGRHESLTPARAGTRSNLLPLQNCHGTHSHVLHESLHSSRLERPQTLLPLQNSQRTHNAVAHKSLHNIEQEYHHILLPLQNCHGTRNSYETWIFQPSTLTGPQDAFGKILCGLTSAVDTRVGRPSRLTIEGEFQCWAGGALCGYFLGGLCRR